MNETSPTRTPGRPQSAELDHAILFATVEVLAEVGYEALSVAEVARRANSTTPAVYRRYAGKVELVIAALESELGNVRFEVPDHGDLRSDLLAWVTLTKQSLTIERVRVIAAMFLAARDNPEPAKLLFTAIEQVAGHSWAAILERARARGELVPSDNQLALIGHLTPALILQASIMRLSEETDVAQLVDTILLPSLRAA